MPGEVERSPLERDSLIFAASANRAPQREDEISREGRGEKGGEDTEDVLHESSTILDGVKGKRGRESQ